MWLKRSSLLHYSGVKKLNLFTICCLEANTYLHCVVLKLVTYITLFFLNIVYNFYMLFQFRISLVISTSEVLYTPESENITTLPHGGELLIDH